tara:strand:- start:7801 stop:8460 length:660 start_codon:yes stop_codon:yes gene_type:complete
MRSGNDTDYKTIIAHQKEPDARRALAQILINIPREFDLTFSEGSETHQVENMISFVLHHFKTISPNQIREAIELNAARKFEHKVEAYGKFSQEFLGSILHEFINWRANQRQRGTISLDPEMNIPRELSADWNRLKANKDLKVTSYISEKYDHLVGAGAIQAEDSKDIEKRTRQIKKDLEDPTHRTHQFKDYADPMIWAIQDIRAEKIKAFLITYKPPKP